jgi:hypothetical protein
MTARINSTSQLHLSISDSERAYEPYIKQLTEIGGEFSRFIVTLGKLTHGGDLTLFYFSFNEATISSPI